jgi:NADH dehydrogenase
MSRSAEQARGILEQYGEGRRALEEGRLTFAEADVTQLSTLSPAVRDVDIVVQAVQFKGAPVEDPSRGLTYMNVDRNGTLNLLQAIAETYGAPTAGPGMARFPNGSPRFIYLSGVSVSPDNPHTWDLAKWQAEEAIRGSGLDWTIVRCCPMFGPGDISFNRLVGYSDLLPFVPLFGSGKVPLTPLFVEDLGRFMATIVDAPEKSVDTTFVLGGPDRVSLDDFIHLELRARHRQRGLLHVPKPLGKLQGALLQHFPGRPLTPSAVDFISQEGAATEADRALVGERFPTFATTPVKEALEGFLGP